MLNPISNTKRNLPMQGQMDAGGGYTLPQHVFIPHPVTQQLQANGSHGQVVVADPRGGSMAEFAILNHPTISNRPYPQVSIPAVGVRIAIQKQSPGINS